MQTATKKAEDRAARSTDDNGDLFDPYFPGLRVTSKLASATQSPAFYDPYFPTKPQAKNSAHV
jgi:hypothetical protein